MNLVRNILSLIGIVTVIVGIGAYAKLSPMLAAFDKFDDDAVATYSEMVSKLIETGNPAEATVWKVLANEDQSFEDIDQTIKVVANEHNIKNVGELPLWKQVAAMTGEEQRIAKIYMFCNPLTAFQMMDFSDAYSAYLPCRISVVEDKKQPGRFWIYTLNMDMMIHGGMPLPEPLRSEALKVKMIMLDVLKRAKEGDF
ncbi:MAG: DUF302 domain-containing protein [Rhodospirillaceae bacterium]|jgi:uncharacterized protein (DUF302 family)|nr:DUF302 domain-containing protein [Rhodospirillaceae bacterium]